VVNPVVQQEKKRGGDKRGRTREEGREEEVPLLPIEAPELKKKMDPFNRSTRKIKGGGPTKGSGGTPAKGAPRSN